MYVGQPYLIRGYDPNSFTVDECVSAAPGGDDSCPEFNRLIGSRIAVANVELRIPLFGNEELGLINLPFLPTEIAPFVDVGAAWGRSGLPELRFDRKTADRIPVVSTGVSARINLFGYMVVEAYYVHPFQRQVKGSHFGFQLQPGW
jgi:outer membrane protein assembly factor BamA